MSTRRAGHTILLNHSIRIPFYTINSTIVVILPPLRTDQHQPPRTQESIYKDQNVLAVMKLSIVFTAMWVDVTNTFLMEIKLHGRVV
jgi:hypothetical protein